MDFRVVVQAEQYGGEERNKRLGVVQYIGQNKGGGKIGAVENISRMYTNIELIKVI